MEYNIHPCGGLRVVGMHPISEETEGPRRVCITSINEPLLDGISFLRKPEVQVACGGSFVADSSRGRDSAGAEEKHYSTPEEE